MRSTDNRQRGKAKGSTPIPETPFLKQLSLHSSANNVSLVDFVIGQWMASSLLQNKGLLKRRDVVGRPYNGSLPKKRPDVLAFLGKESAWKCNGPDRSQLVYPAVLWPSKDKSQDFPNCNDKNNFKNNLCHSPLSLKI